MQSKQLCLFLCFLLFALHAAEKPCHAQKSSEDSSSSAAVAKKTAAKETTPADLPKGKYPEIDAFLDKLFSLVAKTWKDPHPEKHNPPTMVYTSVTFTQKGEVLLGMRDAGSPEEDRALTTVIESFSKLPLLPKAINGPMNLRITCVGSEVTVEWTLNDRNNQKFAGEFVSPKVEKSQKPD